MITPIFSVLLDIIVVVPCVPLLLGYLILLCKIIITITRPHRVQKMRKESHKPFLKTEYKQNISCPYVSCTLYSSPFSTICIDHTDATDTGCVAVVAGPDFRRDLAIGFILTAYMRFRTPSISVTYNTALALLMILYGPSYRACSLTLILYVFFS